MNELCDVSDIPDFEDADEKNGTKVTELFHVFSRFHRVDFLKQLKITKSEYMALSVLEQNRRAFPEQPGIYVSVLVQSLRMAPPQVSRLLKTMQDKEMIERMTDSRDRRNTYVFMTEKGKAILQENKEIMRRHFRSVMQQFGDENLDEFIRLCNMIVDIMEKS